MEFGKIFLQDQKKLQKIQLCGHLVCFSNMISKEMEMKTTKTNMQIVLFKILYNLSNAMYAIRIKTKYPKMQILFHKHDQTLR